MFLALEDSQPQTLRFEIASYPAVMQGKLWKVGRPPLVLTLQFHRTGAL